MKRMLAMLLAALLCAGCFCASAEEAPVSTDIPVAGLRLTWPEAFTETVGTVMADGAFSLNNGIYYAYWFYCAAPPEETRELIAKGSRRLQSDYLFYTFSVAENRELSEAVALINEQGFGIREQDMILIGEAEAWKFYLCMAFDPDFAAHVQPEYAEEYSALCGMKDEIVSRFTCSVPFNEYGDLTGRVIRIAGTDLDGNPVSFEELTGEHAVSLVNIWATWCGPCISELSELQEIYARNLDQDCGMIGLMIDTDAEEARALISENGITYPMIMVPREFSMIFPFEAVPTTFFADRNGLFLETKFTGAYPDMYEDALLAHRNQQEE